jgi:hypothetical protein
MSDALYLWMSNKLGDVFTETEADVCLLRRCGANGVLLRTALRWRITVKVLVPWETRQEKLLRFHKATANIDIWCNSGRRDLSCLQVIVE